MEQGTFNLSSSLKSYVLCSPVPIQLNGKRIGGDPNGALREAGENLQDLYCDLFPPLEFYNALTLDELLEPDLLLIDAWADEPIIETDKGMVSLRDVLSTKVEPNEIHDPVAKRRSFVRYCAAALIQAKLNVKAVWDGRAVKILFAVGAPCSMSEGLRLFPPLTFLPMQSKDLLKPVTIPDYNRIFNMEHQFSVWILERASLISDLYPGLFETIRSQIVGYSRWAEVNWATLERILSRLRSLDPRVRPPEGSLLKKPV